jgi:dethiobiotin synthetase
MKIPIIVVAGTHSGVGKTTTATGIMAALRRRGLSYIYLHFFFVGASRNGLSSSACNGAQEF